MSTGRAYSGINTIVLQASAISRGYSSPVWGTYQAFAKAGGQVRRRLDSVPAGRWVTTALYYNPVERRTTDDNGDEKVERFPLLDDFRKFYGRWTGPTMCSTA
ncbi:MAG: ArdC-like ssDNA-binding domain-containing protein [Gemmataceae bacterium]